MAPPVRMRYGWGKYLSDDWGIDVLTDYLVVPAVVDENDPDSFKVSITRFSHLQLSAFSEHPIALPLRAQRLLWTGLCPIRTKPLCPEYVSVTPLLSIPAAWRDTWATRNLPKLLAQFQSGEGSRIRPDYTAGDIPAPFDVAVAATRGQAQQATSAPATTQATTKPTRHARIVVLGLSTALSDDYINRQVEVFDARGTLTLTDPPKANADIVVNSLYWLTDKPGYIAAGPSGTQFVIIDGRTRAILSAMFVLVLPIAVLVCGGIVMMARKR